LKILFNRKSLQVSDFAASTPLPAGKGRSGAYRSTKINLDQRTWLVKRNFRTFALLFMIQPWNVANAFTEISSWNGENDQ